MESLYFWLVVFVAIGAGITGRAYERELWTKRMLDLLSKQREDPTERPRELAPPARREFDAAQLANALDALAVEVERIGESQRFLTKVLAERDARVIPSKATSPMPGVVRSPIPPSV